MEIDYSCLRVWPASNHFRWACKGHATQTQGKSSFWSKVWPYITCWPKWSHKEGETTEEISHLAILSFAQHVIVLCVSCWEIAQSQPFIIWRTYMAVSAGIRILRYLMTMMRCIILLLVVTQMGPIKKETTLWNKDNLFWHPKANLEHHFNCYA